MNRSRLTALMVKEAKQLLRDTYSILLGILLPLVLLLICGYGLSTDIRNIKLAIVVPENSQYASQLAARFQLSPYFDAIIVRSTEQGKQRVQDHRSDACLFLPQDMPRKAAGGNLEFLIAVNASNPSPAMIKESYIRAILLGEISRIALQRGNVGTSVEVRPRQWFNDAYVSAYTIVPGIIVIILTMIGALLTSIVMAREYEHGNMESMFVTPMKSSEILLAKTANNFMLGIVGLILSLIMARYVFAIPIRGSLIIVFFGSSVYLVMTLCMGLLISSITKNQFMAVEITLFTTFLPSYLLSGFLFEIKSMPTILQWITVFVPARYFVDFLQTTFLVGNVWPNIAKNLGILTLFALVFLILAKYKNPKRLE